MHPRHDSEGCSGSHFITITMPLNFKNMSFAFSFCFAEIWLPSKLKTLSRTVESDNLIILIINFNKDQAWFPPLLAVSGSFVTVDKDIRRQGVCLRSLTEKIEEKTPHQMPMNM